MEPVRSPFRHPHRCQGFTLMELLVVVAILAILAALAIPASMKASEVGQRASVTSQMRQMTMAILQYAGDNDGKLPGPLLSSHGFRYKNSHPEFLLTNIALYLGCPAPNGNWQSATTLLTPKQRAWYQKIPSDNANYFRITVDGSVQPFGYYSGTTLPMKLSALADQSNVVMLKETDQQAKWVYPSNGGFENFPPRPLHGNARFVSYFDGRIEGLPIADTTR